jgi:hypothetical protein
MRQARTRLLHLQRHPSRGQNPQIRTPADRDHLVQQRRLSDASLTAEHKRSTGPGSGQQAAGVLNLVLPSKKGHAIP